MLLNKSTKFKDFLIGFVLSSFVLSPFVYSSDLLETQPYYSVTPVEIRETVDGDILVNANFIKNGACDFVKMEVIGYSLGLWMRVEWDTPLGPIPNRLSGNQTLSVILITKDSYYQEYQIKTRHNCRGNIVDRTFLEFKSEEIKPYGKPT